MALPSDPHRSQRGFTLVETLIVVALIGIIALFTMPALLQTIKREKLTGTARQAITMMRLARSEAVRRSTPCGAALMYRERKVVAFRDSNGNGQFDADEPVTGEFLLPNAVVAQAPGGDSPCDLFLDDGSGQCSVTFDRLGAASSTGAFRFGDQSLENYVEARVETQATGKVVLQKWFGGTNWYEQGEDGHDWTWQ